MNAATEDAISASISAADSITTLCDQLYDHIGNQTPTLALVDGIKALAEKVDRLLVGAQGSDAAPTLAPALAGPAPDARAADLDDAYGQVDAIVTLAEKILRNTDDESAAYFEAVRALAIQARSAIRPEGGAA
jgi:hypothetical protein